ncbi:hypothetical protein BJV77DRAFT_1008010 [Russula vinacea]|jgi:hypothetical protein|nr:hypothetical protein BJV77DRAFT_1008010 [Russula vinacea]
MRSRPSQYALFHCIFFLPCHTGALSRKPVAALTMAGEAEIGPQMLLDHVVGGPEQRLARGTSICRSAAQTR